jgi:hypothetical protein
MSLLDEKYPMSKVNNSQEEQNKWTKFICF